jgi:serine/threonine protein kinase
VIVRIQYSTIFKLSGDLLELKHKCLKERKHIEEKIIVNWFIELIDSLILAKSKNLMHRDIKPQNIFIMDTGSIKLGDFGRIS